MADAMMKAAQAAYDGNEQYIQMLSEQLKAAKERKKILKEALKREKAHYKEHEGDESLGGFRPCGKRGCCAETACLRGQLPEPEAGPRGQPIPAQEAVDDLERKESGA